MTTPPLPRTALPARLARTPLWRAPDAAQFGADPASALVLEGLTPPLRALVDGLAGARPTVHAVADAVARGARPAEVTGTLDDLAAAGLLAPPAEGRAAAAYVLVQGAGRLGVAVATLLAGAGIGRVAVRARGVVGRDDTGTGLTDDDLGRPAVAAAAAAVARSASGVTVAEPTRRRPDLVVLTGPAAGDPVLSGRLHTRHQPHLAATARETTGTVGPLVLPGRTSCLRCADRHRADADPAWPRVAAQLAAAPSPVPVALAGLVAGVVTGCVLAFLDGGPGPTDTALEVDPVNGASIRRSRPPHPGCPCGCDGPPPRAGAVHAGDNR